MLGNVFGNADLVISGQGIQVILEWTPEELAFDTTAIGQQSSATLTITSSGDGAGTITDAVFSNDIFSLDEANSSLTIDEGTSGDLTFLFSPTGAGVFNETVDLYTNDPNNSVITLPLSAVGISEVSGEVCDVTWSLADSPFTLIGDVTVPEGCSLTIEPGVSIEMLGHSLQVNGELVCSGTVDSPITATGGVITLGPGAPALVEYLIYSGSSGTEVVDSPYEMVYYNNFESSTGQYDFDCFDEYNNSYVTGTTDNYSSYGCNDFYRTSSSSYSLQENSGDYYLRFYSSNGGDGYLYLDNAPVAPTSGEYDFSFTFESDRYEQQCFMSIDVFDEGEWITLYESPMDIESNSTFTRFARATYFFNEGDEMQFRIMHHNGVNSGNSNDMYTYLDEVRIERKRSVVNEVKWDFYENVGDFNSLSSNYGYYGGVPRVQLVDSVLKLNAAQTNINFETSSWSNPPIIVPESGWYYIEMDNRLISASQNTYNYWYYKSTQDNNSWYYVIENRDQYSTDVGAIPYEWRKEAIRSYQYLTEGSRIDFYYYGYYWTTAGEINWEGRDFRIYQLSESVDQGQYSLFQTYPAAFESARDLNMTGISGNTLSVNGALEFSDGEIDGTIACSTNAEALISNSSMDSLVVTGSAVVDSSIIGYVEISEVGELSNTEMEKVYGDNLLTLQNCLIQGSDGDGINTAEVVLEHTEVTGNANNGINAWTVSGTNSIISNNGLSGITASIVDLNYVTLSDNQNGLVINADSEYSTVTNSVISNNVEVNLPSSDLLLEEYNYTGNYPQFQEGSYMLEAYSPCVDAAMPWNTDQNMPYGMGGLRADMGAYGGPNNAGWGGSPAPDGAATLQAASDYPQDQGYVLGLTFDASAFDNSIITDNISHYAVWRHYDPTGESIASLDDGNWELLGTMPAQGFSGYAYQAEALGNTNDFGSFTSCYTVVAHTDNEDVVLVLQRHVRRGRGQLGARGSRSQWLSLGNG